MRYVIPYNEVSLYAGPAPATGFHFINLNSYALTDNESDHNLVRQIHRVQDSFFEINRDLHETKSLGVDHVISRAPKNLPTVNLTFSYLQYGIHNEYKLGFNTNFNYNNYQYYLNNYSQSIFGGFVSRDLVPEKDATYPYRYKDCRNIFIALNPKGYDSFNDRNKRSNAQKVLGFGNCYLNSYNIKGAIGDIPSATVNYTCENLVSYSAATGYIPTPRFNTKKFIIPTGQESSTVTALRPGDITIAISGRSYGLSLNPFGYDNNTFSHNAAGTLAPPINITGLTIQSYEINSEIRRKALKSLTNTGSFDYAVLSPIQSTINLSVICDDFKADNLFNYMNRENVYDLILQINNPARVGGTAMRYDCRSAVLKSLSYNHSINSAALVNLSFVLDSSFSTSGKGIFLSGSLNTNDVLNLTNYLTDETNDPILTESSEYIELNDPIPYF